MYLEEAILAPLLCSGLSVTTAITYMLQRQMFQLQLLPQLQWKLIRPGSEFPLLLLSSAVWSLALLYSKTQLAMP